MWELELNHKSQKNRIEERKTEHLTVCLEKDVEAKRVKSGFEDIHLIHRALPEINRDDVDLSIDVFKHKFSAPLFISGITGGTEIAMKVNSAIAQAVEELGLGMGVGSQRAALKNPSLERTYSIVRKKAPTAFISANIGAPQLVREFDLKQVKKAVDMIQADALTIHLNPLQEAVQPEGEAYYAGVLSKIYEIVNKLEIPVIVKETGAGIAAEDALKLKNAGVLGIDVAGTGGTSWAAVEYYRAKQREDIFRQELGRNLWDWGIPTITTLVEVVQSVDLSIIASGGVRSGIDIAKTLALGADLSGFALPMLRPALKSSKEVVKKLTFLILELKTTMFLVGAKSTLQLKAIPLVITGKTAEWLRIRGFNLENYSKRGGQLEKK